MPKRIISRVLRRSTSRSLQLIHSSKVESARKIDRNSTTYLKSLTDRQFFGLHVWVWVCMFFFARAHWFARWTRTRNREINHCALRWAAQGDFLNGQTTGHNTRMRSLLAVAMLTSTLLSFSSWYPLFFLSIKFWFQPSAICCRFLSTSETFTFWNGPKVGVRQPPQKIVINHEKIKIGLPLVARSVNWSEVQIIYWLQRKVHSTHHEKKELPRKAPERSRYRWFLFLLWDVQKRMRTSKQSACALRGVMVATSWNWPHGRQDNRSDVRQGCWVAERIF